MANQTLDIPFGTAEHAIATQAPFEIYNLGLAPLLPIAGPRPCENGVKSATFQLHHATEQHDSVKVEHTPHQHPSALEFFIVLEGWIEFEVNQERVRIGQNQALGVSPGVWHRMADFSREKVGYLVLKAGSSLEKQYPSGQVTAEAA